MSICSSDRCEAQLSTPTNQAVQVSISPAPRGDGGAVVGVEVVAVATVVGLATATQYETLGAMVQS